MDLACYLPEGAWERVPALAQHLESLGLARIWASEIAHDAFLPLALAAPVTSRIGLATGVSIAFGRTPMGLAMPAWDLGRLSGGRFALGLGTQVKPHIVRRWGGHWEAPIAQLRETVQAIRAIWRSWQDGAPLNHRGRFFQLTLMTPTFNPGPNPGGLPPIALAGVNAGLCMLAGSIADLFLVHSFNSPEYVKQVVQPALAEGARAAGRDPAAVRLICPAMVATGADRAAVDRTRRLIRAQIGFYASTPSYRVILDVHGLGGLADRLRKLAAAGRWDDMTDLVDDSVEAAFGVVGTYDEIGGLIHDRYAGIADEVTTLVVAPLDEELDAWTRIAAGFFAKRG